MATDISQEHEFPATVTTLYERVPNDQKGMEEFEVDLEGRHRQYMRSVLVQFRPNKPFDGPQITVVVKEICLISAIFVLPNLAAIAMSFFYVFAQLHPTSQISAALHATRVTWLVFQIFLPLACVGASLANLLLLFAGIKCISRSVLLMFLAVIVACTPIWCPYVVEAGIRKTMWDHVCDGYDANIFVDAVNYNSGGFSYAQFPATMLGGVKWQIYQNTQGIYEFGPVGGTSEITYDFRALTYDLHGSTTGTGSGHLTEDDAPLSFPDFGLNSTGSWVRSCSAPAVNLQNATGSIVVKTGLSAYTDCSKMEICAMTGGGVTRVLVALGRILIALEQASQCCTRTKWN